MTVVLTCTLWAADSGTRLRCKVLDGTKALVPSAKLTLHGGNFTATGATNNEGEYLFVNGPLGVHQLTIEKEGFSRASLDSIVLDLTEFPVLNVTLAPKSDVQTVEVRADQVSIVPQQTCLHGQMQQNSRIWKETW